MAAYQIPGFHFQVTFNGLPGGKPVDVAFQSVSGLDVQFDVETVREGGENTFEHVLPNRRRYSDLTLKRGLLLPGQSGLTDWCVEAFNNFRFTPLNTVEVQLLNEENTVMAQWELAWVWPKSWRIAELNAERSEVLIETLELHYNRFKFKV